MRQRYRNSRGIWIWIELPEPPKEIKPEYSPPVEKKMYSITKSKFNDFLMTFPKDEFNFKDLEAATGFSARTARKVVKDYPSTKESYGKPNIYSIKEIKEIRNEAN